MDFIHSKPAPYMVQQDSNPIRQSAARLREIFRPLMAKRLPTVLYGGFKHGFIPAYIQKHKKTHSFFLTVDIEKFYPSLSHHHLLVETQMAYKMLLGLPYVPKGFKKEFLPAAYVFFRCLPLQEQGVPLNSAFSKALAPLVYVPFFLTLKKQDGVRFIVFVDDILILTTTRAQSQKVYIQLFQFLQSVQLKPNMGKIQQGRFASGSMRFCGYEFAGGYVRIAPVKIEVFKAKIVALVKKCAKKGDTLRSPRGFIKKINQSISGFGHYYKCGQVKHVFEKLDGYIRNQVRQWFAATGRLKPSNRELEHLGLMSLTGLLLKKRQGIVPLKNYEESLTDKVKLRSLQKQQSDTLFAYLEKLKNQNTEIVGQLKKIVKLLEI